MEFFEFDQIDKMSLQEAQNEMRRLFKIGLEDEELFVDESLDHFLQAKSMMEVNEEGWFDDLESIKKFLKFLTFTVKTMLAQKRAWYAQYN